MKQLFLIFAFLFAFSAVPVLAGDGRFETRWQNVLVRESYYERVWIDGYWRDVYVPARYERKIVQVWIPERKGGGSFNIGITWNWRTW